MPLQGDLYPDRRPCRAPFTIKSIGQVDEAAGILHDVVMTAEEWDREGELVSLKDLQWEEYRKNPVVLWHHMSHLGPIGRALNLRVVKDELHCDVEFDLELPFAANIFRQYARGFLKAWSLGGGVLDAQAETSEDGKVGRRLTVEVWELSATPVGSNRRAMSKVAAAALADDEDACEDIGDLLDLLAGFAPEAPTAAAKGAISYSVHGDAKLAPVGAKWDAGKEIKAAGDDLKLLRKMCTWKAAGASSKSDFKLPHHRAKDLAVVWKGVTAAYAAVQGARGGVRIPAADKAGVLAHLKKHYKQFDKPWPADKGAAAAWVSLDAAAYAPNAFGKSLQERGVAGTIPVTLEQVETRKEAGAFLLCEALKHSGDTITEARVHEVALRVLQASARSPLLSSRGEEPHRKAVYSEGDLDKVLAAADALSERLSVEARHLALLNRTTV